MPNSKSNKVITLPINVKLTLINNKHKLNSNFFFFVYPVKSDYLICYNFLSYGFSISKFLPFFSLFVLNNKLIFIINNLNFNNIYSSIIIYAFNTLYKTIMFASFGCPRLLQFIGFRFRHRWFTINQMLRLRLGYNKKVWVKCPNDFIMFTKKVTPKKRNHILFSFDKNCLSELIRFLLMAREASLYKGRGINIREKPILLKEGKKTLW